MAANYETKFMSEEAIEEMASYARRIGFLQGAESFNICEYITDNLIPTYRKKGEIRLCLLPAPTINSDGTYKPEAYVEYGQKTPVGYTPVKLCIDQETWERAYEGDAEARFVVAHEIGHILLHEYGSVNFTAPIDASRKDLIPLQTVEGQADVFGWAFLMPMSLMPNTNDWASIQFRFRVTKEDLLERLKIIKQMRSRERLAHARVGSSTAKGYEGEACAECANFTLVRNGTYMKCDTCGGTTGCS